MVNILQIQEAFREVEYYDREHMYLYRGKRLESVTHFRDRYKRPFRTDYWATFKVLESEKRKVLCDARNHIPEDHYELDGSIIHYNDIDADPEKIKAKIEQWENEAEQGKLQGSKVHRYMELATRRKYEHLKNEFLSSAIYKDHVPLAEEVIVADFDQGIAGQLDRLVYYKGVQLRDWKTDKEIEYENMFESLLEPLDELGACNFNEYMIQLNLYRHCIEKYTDIRIDEIFIDWIRVNEKKYEEIPVPRYNVEKLLEYDLARRTVQA